MHHFKPEITDVTIRYLLHNEVFMRSLLHHSKPDVTMRYLLHTRTSYERLMKKFERTVLTHAVRDSSEMAVCLRSFFVSLASFSKRERAITSSLTRSDLWAHFSPNRRLVDLYIPCNVLLVKYIQQNGFTYYR